MEILYYKNILYCRWLHWHRKLLYVCRKCALLNFFKSTVLERKTFQKYVLWQWMKLFTALSYKLYMTYRSKAIKVTKKMIHRDANKPQPTARTPSANSGQVNFGSCWEDKGNVNNLLPSVNYNGSRHQVHPNDPIVEHTKKWFKYFSIVPIVDGLK